MIEGIEKIRNELRGKRELYLLVPEFLKELDAIEREVSEKYTELPKDVNGNTVRYGGYAKVYPYDGKPMKVKALRLSGFGWSVVFEDGSREYLYRVLAFEPPTVEDVLEEFASERIKLFLRMPMAVSDEGIEEYRKNNYEACEKLIAEYAAKLQVREAE